MTIENNTTKLQSLLEQANALPDAGGVELPELSNPASTSEIFKNKEAIDGDGNKIAGTFTIDNEIDTIENLLTELETTLVGKAGGSDDVNKVYIGTVAPRNDLGNNGDIYVVRSG